MLEAVVFTSVEFSISKFRRIDGMQDVWEKYRALNGRIRSPYGNIKCWLLYRTCSLGDRGAILGLLSTLC